MPSPVILVNDGSPYQSTSGGAYVSSNALADISPIDILLPAMFVWHTGSLLRFTAYGTLSTSSSAPTLTLGLYIGSSTTIGSNTSMGASAAITTTASLTNNTWRAEWSMRVNLLGGSGTALTQGFMQLPTSTTTGASSLYTIPSAASATGGSATFINTQANYAMIGATWGTASAANTLTCYQWIVEALDS